MSKPNRTGLLIILSSPSGAGKSTLARRLIDENPDVTLSVSATTRVPRPGEIDGKDYRFVSKKGFESMIEAGDLLEHACVFDNFYGTPRAPVEAAIGAGRDILFDVDWQGAQQIRTSGLAHALVSIFILPPSIGALEARLRSRAQDSDPVIQGRMHKARDEISHWAEYDYVLINDDLATCYSQIDAILRGERMRLSRQPGLGAVVERLNREFEER